MPCNDDHHESLSLSIRPAETLFAKNISNILLPGQCCMSYKWTNRSSTRSPVLYGLSPRHTIDSANKGEAKMSESPNPIRAILSGKLDNHRGVLPGGWLLRGAWKAVDPLYVWSAVVGLFVALVLIAVSQVLQTGRLH